MYRVDRAWETGRLVESGRYGGLRRIRLRFNEHANDRGSSAVQRRPTSLSTCFPRASFTRNCKAGWGRNSFPFWSTGRLFEFGVIRRSPPRRPRGNDARLYIFSLILITETGITVSSGRAGKCLTGARSGRIDTSADRTNPLCRLLSTFWFHRRSRLIVEIKIAFRCLTLMCQRIFVINRR